MSANMTEVWKRAAKGHRATARSLSKTVEEMTEAATAVAATAVAAAVSDIFAQHSALADFVAANERAWMDAKDEADNLRKKVAELEAQVLRSQEIPF